MHSLITPAITGVVSFVLGTIFGRLALNRVEMAYSWSTTKAQSEATSVKQHVTAEVDKLRADITKLLSKA